MFWLTLKRSMSTHVNVRNEQVGCVWVYENLYLALLNCLIKFVEGELKVCNLWRNSR